MKYRTLEQAIEIYENWVNGNWTDARKGAIEYGFAPYELWNTLNEYFSDMGYDDTFLKGVAEDIIHLCIIKPIERNEL